METPTTFRREDYTITKIKIYILKVIRTQLTNENMTEHIKNLITKTALLNTEIDIKGKLTL